MKINITGNIMGTSGYAVHTLNTLLALDKLCDVSLNCPPFENMESSPYWKFISKDYSKEINLMIILPDYWRLYYPEKHKKLIGFLVFEGTKLPLNWVRNANDKRLDMIFVPSLHTMTSCLNSGVIQNIEIIPHGHNPEIFKPEGDKIWNDDKFRFLFVGGWKDGLRDRKGLDIALRAFKEEFKNQDDVIFIAKINMAYGGNIRVHLEGLNLPKRLPGIDVLPQNLPPMELAKLYRSCDVFVLSTKAEAFGMPCLESMACGTPVITTDYGGQTDYVNKKNGWLIKKKMIPATGGMLYENVEWAMPSQDHLQKLMREAYENRKLLAKKRLNAIKTAKGYTWLSTGKKIIKALNQVSS